MRDDRKGGTKESVNLVRECKVMAKEEVWLESGRDAGPNKSTNGIGRSRNVELRRGEWVVRRDFTNNEAIWERCCFHYKGSWSGS